MMPRRAVLAACGALATAAASAQGRRRVGAPLRAVFHLVGSTRAEVVRGLSSARNALAALGDAPADFVLVAHGPALAFFVRSHEDPVAAELAEVLASRRASWRACARTLAEHGWQARDLLPGATVVPSGTLEILRLQQRGYAYVRP